MRDLPVLYHVVPALRSAPKNVHKYFVLLLTFLAYTAYHLSRWYTSPPTDVFTFRHLSCSFQETDFYCEELSYLPDFLFISGNRFLLWRTLTSSWTARTQLWPPMMAPAHPGSVRQSIVHQSLLKNSSLSQIDGKSPEKAKTYLGMLDTTYLFSYAFFMFFSGFVAERMNLRYFLSLGMIFRFQEILQFGWTIEIFMKCNLPSGISTWLFGFSYVAGIHSLWYLLIVQVFLASWCWSHLSHFPQTMCFMVPEKNWQYTYFEVESSLGEMCFQLVYFCKCDKTI